MTDLRIAFRSLRAAPLVSLVAILSLALGIGANTAIFSIVDALLLRSLPVERAERLVVMRAGEGRGSWTNSIWEQLREQKGLLEGTFAAGSQRFNAAPSGAVDLIEGLFASGAYFDVLRVRPVLGRTFTTEDDRRGGGANGPVAVISHALWQSRFGGAQDVIGRSFTLDRVAFTIIGVTPRGFFGHTVGRRLDVFVPLGTEPLVRGAESALDKRSYWWMTVMGRLKPGQTVEQATALLRRAQPAMREATIPQQYRAQDAARYLTDPLGFYSASAGTSSLRTQYQRPLLALSAVVAFTLLIACGNIANLMLARTSARRHEFAVRTALGASRWRLARQLLSENVLLSGVGAALGVLVAIWGSRLIIAQISNEASRVYLDIGLDWRMLAFTALVAITTTILFGVAPTLFATRVPPMHALKAQGRGTSSSRAARFAGSLVLVQVSLSLLLLVAAGLFVRTFVGLADVALGFVPERALVVNVNAQRAAVSPADRYALYERVREAALAVPGVTRAAIAVITPSSGMTWNNDLSFPERPELSEEQRLVNFNYLSPGWFATMGTRLIAGRDFDNRDRVGGTRVVIVNQKFAEKYFGGANPMGKQVRTVARPDEPSEALEIIGLVGDAVYESPRDPLTPTMYWAMAQEKEATSSVSLTVRTTTSEPAALNRSLTEAITGVHADLSVSFRPLEDFLDASLAQERLIAMLSGFFGGLSLLLSALGLYGITAYAVTRRRSELGIRMALGASPAGVVRLVMSRTGALVAGGIVIGGLASWWASRFISALLFGLAPTDPVTIVSAMGLLAIVGAVAGWLPARRAARIDPAEVLRAG